MVRVLTFGTVVDQKFDRVCELPLYLTFIVVPFAAVLESGVCMAGKREMRSLSA